MTTIYYLDRVKFSTPTTGTGGTISVGAASSGFQTPGGAGAVDARVYRYKVEDTSNAWEIGYATYNAAGTALINRTVTSSSNSNSAINLSGSGVVALIAAANDMVSAIKTVWNPDTSPSSPSAYDDEFDGGSGGMPTSGLWTKFDPASKLTVVEDSTYKLLQLQAATHSGNGITGIYQTIPAGDFTIWTRLALMGTRTNYLTAGLALWENPSDTTKSITINSLNMYSSFTSWEVAKYTNYTTYNSNPVAYTGHTLSHVYLRIRRNSTNYYHAMSLDGIGWQEYPTAVNPLATPTKFGVYVDNVGTGITNYANFSFFRYTGSDLGVTGMLSGRLNKILA